MKKVFISGKITGEPIIRCLNKFYSSRREILDLLNIDMYNIIIPLHLRKISFCISHERAMYICIKELKTCTHIYMLKDWKESKGAMIEHEFAKENNIEIIYQK